MATPRLSPLTFDALAQRLVRDLAKLVHSGAVTERRLAAMVGLSQSHLHNVVNGLRNLTPSVADQIMERLDWSLMDLVDSAEARALLTRRQEELTRGREIPLAHSALGRGLCLPGSHFTEITVPNVWFSGADNPVAVSAGVDIMMEKLLMESDIAVIDPGLEARSTLDEDTLYVVRSNGESLARWLRFSTRGLYLVSVANWSEPARWDLLVQPATRRMEPVEGKIIALLRPPDGTFQRPVPPSASN